MFIAQPSVKFCCLLYKNSAAAKNVNVCVSLSASELVQYIAMTRHGCCTIIASIYSK